MKRLFAILTVIAVCLPVRAQHFDPEHRHAIEISSGLPPLHGFMLGGGSRMRWNGIRETTHLRACLNLGYTYAISEKWDFNFVVDAVSQFYTQEKFRSIDLVNPDGSVAEGRDYDWKSDPVSVDHSSRWWVSFNFDFRWKWYRTDAVRLYTAFGLGYLPSQIPILPYIAPVGINFGANHFYGVAELNFSPAASIILLGAGYRF